MKTLLCTPIPQETPSELWWLSVRKVRRLSLFCAVLFTTVVHNHKHTLISVVNYRACWFRYTLTLHAFLAVAVLLVLRLVFWVVSFGSREFGWVWIPVQSITWEESSPQWPILCVEWDVKLWSLRPTASAAAPSHGGHIACALPVDWSCACVGKSWRKGNLFFWSFMVLWF